MSRDEIIAYLGDDWRGMLDLVRSSLESDVLLLKDTNESVLSRSGKLLRPMISLLISRALGTPTEDSLRYAAACELLHNATLLHDDVADESSLRRGQPTVSALLGPSAAVLVGDFWLARAVELVFGSSHYRRVVRYFSKILTDMAEGEMFQMEKAANADMKEEDYLRIIYCKTASLFEAAGASAADSVEADSGLFGAARDFARYFGIAFQIKDDILDYAGTDELGKPVGADLREQKITLPLLGAMSGSPEEPRIREMVRNIHSHPEYCDEVKDFVLANGGIEYASRRLEEYVGRSLDALSAIPDSAAKDFLASIARFNAFRQV